MSTRISSTWVWPGRLCLGVALGLVILGCGKKNDATGGNDSPPGLQTGFPAPGAGPPPDEVFAQLPGGEEFAAGKRVYANNACANCHKLGETGGKMGGGPGGGGPGGKAGGPPGGRGGSRGPDLTTVGSKAERTKEWLAEHVRSPMAHRQKSGMPAYGPDKISDADLALLAEYLASRTK